MYAKQVPIVMAEFETQSASRDTSVIESSASQTEENESRTCVSVLHAEIFAMIASP